MKIDLNGLIELDPHVIDALLSNALFGVQRVTASKESVSLLLKGRGLQIQHLARSALIVGLEESNVNA